MSFRHCFQLIAIVLVLFGAAPTASALGAADVARGLAVDVAGSDDARKLAKQGLELLAAKDYEGALTKFRDAQVELPESSELQYNIGVCLYRLERYEEATTAFEAARYGASSEIEQRSLFQLGNCAVKEGKLEDALSHYEDVLEKNPDYEDAKVNREWVIRKIEELARKKKEQDEKQKEQRRYIEKLQEIIQKQTLAHASLRGFMTAKGMELPKTRVVLLSDVLDAPLNREDEAEAPPVPDEDQTTEFFKELAPLQQQVLEATRALVEEGRQRVAADAARTQSPDPNAAGGAGPAGAEAMPDPEAAAIKKALPILEGTLPILERAPKLVENRDDADLHGVQEEALLQLMRALNELQDELTRIIQDEIQLYKNGLTTMADAETEDPARKLGEEDLRDRGLADAKQQREIRQRTNAVTQQVEQQVQQMKSQAATPGSSPQVGQDPTEQLRRMETALGHLLKASTAMDRAVASLEKPDYAQGTEEEKTALEELVKARAALQPPQQSGQDGEKKDEEKKSDDQKEQEEEKKKESEKKNEKKEQGDPDDKPQEKPPEEKKKGQDDQGDKKGKEPEEPRSMSKEQAKKMLERARQEERDRRKKDKKKAREVRQGGGRPVKDW